MPRRMKRPQDPDQSTLATFRITAGDWYEFGQFCEKQGMTASQALTIYISKCLQSRNLNLDSSLDSNLDSNLARTDIESRLDEVMARLEAKDRKKASKPDRGLILSEAEWKVRTGQKRRLSIPGDSQKCRNGELWEYLGNRLYQQIE